jgi:hypothetical protein
VLCHAGPKGELLKADVRMFKSDAVYVALISVDLVLRVSWTYKLSAHLRHLHWFVAVITLLEVVRRWLWAFIRIENELRKVQGKQPQLSPLIPLTPKRKTSEYDFAADIELADRLPLSSKS